MLKCRTSIRSSAFMVDFQRTPTNKVMVKIWSKVKYFHTTSSFNYNSDVNCMSCIAVKRNNLST